MDKNSNYKTGTIAVWGGENAPFWEQSTQVPVVHSVSFGYKDMDKWLKVGQGSDEGYIYSRNTNPTVKAFEDKICRLEGTEAATSFASGMAAISNTLFTLLSPGDRIVSIKDSYGGTNKLFVEFFPRFQINVTLCDTTDHEAIEKEVAAGCKVLYLETPTNPTMKVPDIERLTKAGHAAGAIVIVDNTFATPINQKPVEMGVDLIIHSATKFLGGHADALGGVVCGTKKLVKEIYHYREITGAALDPMAAYLLLRGMKTLHLRVRQQNESAMKVAQHLENHPAVTQVLYPGLKSHPQHEIAKKQMSDFGGMLSFMIKGDLETVNDFLPRLKLAHRAANLGAVETIAGPPAMTSHVECTPEERAAMGIPESLVRYSVGIEDVDDLIADLDQALAGI
ncbi:MAG: cystathionine gamma-synthase family protein [Desulfobacterales bacterium]|nr:cystathionine gamma-synthase family protein [Desulfobacterales bacterium]